MSWPLRLNCTFGGAVVPMQIDRAAIIDYLRESFEYCLPAGKVELVAALLGDGRLEPVAMFLAVHEVITRASQQKLPITAAVRAFERAIDRWIEFLATFPGHKIAETHGLVPLPEALAGAGRWYPPCPTAGRG